jgi:pyrimidine deaminase RibD-like protein
MANWATLRLRDARALRVPPAHTVVRGYIDRAQGRCGLRRIDPHPRNQGRGIEMLRAAGIQVTTEVLTKEAYPHLAPYLTGPDGSAPIGW